MVITAELIRTISDLGWMQGRKLSFQRMPASYLAKAKMLGISPYRLGANPGKKVLGKQSDCIIACEEGDRTTVYSEAFIIADGECLFKDSKFSLIDLRGVDTSGCQRMNDMFSGCRNVELNLSGFNTANVTEMNGMFIDCEFHAPQNLDVSGFDTANVKNMAFMFCCSNIDELDLSSFHLDSLQDTSYMFSELSCRRLNLKNWSIKNIKNTEFMFAGADIDYFQSTNKDLQRCSPATEMRRKMKRCLLLSQKKTAGQK